MMTTTNETTKLLDMYDYDLQYNMTYNYDSYFSGDYVVYKYEQHAELKRSVKIVSLVIYSLVFVLGVLGNGVVIWVTGFKMRKTVNTVWYLNLAVADFLFTAFLPLRITVRALDGHWPFGSLVCKLNSTVFYLNMYASIYNLVVISIDRCVCVCVGWQPWAQKHRSVKKASCVSLGVWVLALALSSPYLVFYETRESRRTMCRANFALTDEHTPAMTESLAMFRLETTTITRFLMGFILPFIAIASCYFVTDRLRMNRSKTKQSGRPFKIIAAVITTHFLCWAPYHILQLSRMAMAESDTKIETLEHVAIIVLCLAYIKSYVNPMLYVFVGQDFKNNAHCSVRKLVENAFIEELPQTLSSKSHGPPPAATESYQLCNIIT